MAWACSGDRMLRGWTLFGAWMIQLQNAMGDEYRYGLGMNAVVAVLSLSLSLFGA